MSRKLKTIYTKVEEPAPVRVLLPYTRITHTLQAVVDCLRIQYVQPEMVKVGGGDEYWRLLNDTWNEGKEFYVVEHDVIVWQGGINALYTCEQDWCTLPIVCHGRPIPTTFGCVKFGQAMIDQRPDFWSDIETTWFYLDAHFADKMGWPYMRPHPHVPPATHLNETQWPDDISIRNALERKIVWNAMDSKHGAVVKVKYRLHGDTPDQEHVADAELNEVNGTVL